MDSHWLPGLGGPELIVIAFVLLAIGIVPLIFYLLTLQKALQRCAPDCRTMPPGQVWLMLIPLFNLVWQFLVVINVSKSLRAEFTRRGIPVADAEPGKGIGLAMCILEACGVVPIIGMFTCLAGFICWIIYWVKIAGFSGMLASPQYMPAAAGAPPYPGAPR